MRAIDLFILVVYLTGVTVFGCSFYFRKNAKGMIVLFASGLGLSLLRRSRNA